LNFNFNGRAEANSTSEPNRTSERINQQWKQLNPVPIRLARLPAGAVQTFSRADPHVPGSFGNLFPVFAATGVNPTRKGRTFIDLIAFFRQKAEIFLIFQRGGKNPAFT
jgi:hypothetical protein